MDGPTIGQFDKRNDGQAGGWMGTQIKKHIKCETQKFPDWPHELLTTYNAVVPLGVLYCIVVVPEYGVFGQKTFQHIWDKCA